MADLRDDTPRTMTIQQVCHELQISRAQFYRLRAHGAFPVPEILPRIGNPRFSRDAVMRYVAGELFIARRKAS